MEEAIRVAPARHNAQHLSSNWRAGASQPIGLVLQLGRGVVIYSYIVRRRRAQGVYDVNIP